MSLRLAENFPDTFRPQPCIHSRCKANFITGGRMKGIFDTEGTIREGQINIWEEQVRTWRHQREEVRNIVTDG